MQPEIDDIFFMIDSDITSLLETIFHKDYKITFGGIYSYLWRLKWIIRREMDCEKEYPALKQNEHN